MGKRLFFWELGGCLWTAAAGTALHFFYDWAGRPAWAAAFSAVNESVWEHMKLLFVPVFLFTLIQLWAMGRRYPNLPAVRAVTALAGTLLIPTLYYTYTGALGTHVLWADILIFLLTDGVLFCLDCRLLRRGMCSAGWQQVAGLAALWGLVFLFVWCTFRPPLFPLWRDMTTGRYGRPFS